MQYMQSTSCHPGCPKVNTFVLDAEPSTECSCGYSASLDGNCLAELVELSQSKWRKVGPQDIDDSYGDWIPANNETEVEEDKGTPPVIHDPQAAGKWTWYEQRSVSSSPYECVLPVLDVDA